MSTTTAAGTRRFLQSVTAYQLIVYGNVVLYSICWMAQVPVLPFLVEKLGAAGSAQYGRLQTVFSAVQFIGGLISGPLMDRRGGRFLFAVSFAASAATYGLTAVASNVWVLYLSRLPTVLQHAVLSARAIVTQLSSEEDRARVLSYVAVSYSVGFTVGPAIGGLLSAVSLQFAASVATIGSALSLVTVLLLLPDLRMHGADQHRQAPQHQREGPRQQDDGADGSEAVGEDKDGSAVAAKGSSGGARQMLMQFVEVARRPGVRDLLTGKLLVGLGSALFQSMFPVLLKRRYNLDPRTTGMVMSYVGMLLLGGQALLVGPVIAAAGEPATEYACVAALAATYVTVAAASALWELLVLLVPLSVAGMLYTTASTSRLTKATLPQQRGTALAIDMSLFSGVRIISPVLGAAAFDRFGHRAVPLMSAATIGVFLLALQLRLLSIPLPPKVVRDAASDTDEPRQVMGERCGSEGARSKSRGSGLQAVWRRWSGGRGVVKGRPVED